MKYILISIFAFFLTATAALAAPVYSHVQVTSGAVDSSGGSGAPDGDYIQIDINGGWAEFGFPEESTYDIRKVYVYETPNSDIAQRPWIKIEFMNGPTVLRTSHQRIDSSTPAGNLSSYIGDDPFDRVRFTKVSGDPLKIDSIWLEAADEEDTGDPETLTIPPETSSTPDTSEPETTSGDATTETSHSTEVTSEFPRLIKLVSDGDPNTQYDTAVYAVDSDDGKRRPFFNETIYFSWFTDFSRVEELSLTEMAAIPLGASMPMHHGTWLIKIQSTADVYAVERDGFIRRIPDEITARAYYGENWADRVRDISPTDWPRYTVGTDITLVHPDEMIIRDGNFIVWHIRNGVRRQIPTLDIGYHGIQEAHVVDYGAILGYTDESRTILDIYTIGAMYTQADDFGWFDF